MPRRREDESCRCRGQAYLSCCWHWCCSAPTVLIVGASRGIGLGLATSYAAQGWEVHATTRTLGSPGELGNVPGNVTL